MQAHTSNGYVTAQDEAMKSGLPIFVSECAGMEASGDGPLDYAEWQRWVDWMDQRQLSWITWSVSDKNENLLRVKTICRF